MPPSRSRSTTNAPDTTLPSPASSVKSSTSSGRSSPSFQSSEDSQRRRRSNRISQQPEVNYKPHQDVIPSYNNEPQLVLKKQKLSNIQTTPVLPQESETVIISSENGKLIFNEPPSSEPIISVTGLPLDAIPNSKIQKESLWPRKKQQSKSIQEDQSKIERTQKRINNLKTQLNEKLQRQSAIRTTRTIQPITKTNHHQQQQNTPSTPEKKKSKDELKRKIKNASPKKKRKNAFGFDNPIQLAGEKRETAFDFSDLTKDNDDFCSACGEPGIFLCCDTCPKSFHFACCNPPFSEDNLPEDEWYCMECKSKKIFAKTTHNTGLFGKLLDQMDTRNPIQFQLPKKIKERFEGVITGNFGEYEDSDYKDYKPTKIHTFQQTDPDLHFDKDGNILICVKCGTSGISPNKTIGEADKLITTCEYCSCSWHLDCLNPPLSSVKQLGKKWKCPNHIDDFLINKKRKLKKPNIIDVDQPVGFKNNGDIEAKLNEDEYEGYHHEIPRPAFFNNVDTQDGISASLSINHKKLWDDSFTVFRLPEKGILIDFWSKIHEEREKDRSRSLEILQLSKENNHLLSNLTSSNQYDKDEKETLQTLIELKDVDFKELLQIAANELNASTIVQNIDITKNELEELRQIKKLMKLKGKDKLLEFLQNA